MTASQPRAGYESVLHITDYYDGPLRGIAEFNGEPHFFDAIFDEVLEHNSKLYSLIPIPQNIVDETKKDRAIGEIEPVLDWVRKTGSEKSFVMTGHFEPLSRNAPWSGGWRVCADHLCHIQLSRRL